jgi:hypothetical protein
MGFLRGENMTSSEKHLSMLFSRLTWPSPLVRERACTAVARLLLTSPQATAIKVFFLRWLESQHHESMCGVALLALLRAKMDAGDDCPILAADVQASLPWPSLQSALLLAEYEPDAVVTENLCEWHSGDPSGSFVVNPFFGEFVRNFLPGVYDFWAKELEGRNLIPFRRQWAYEWDIVLRRRSYDLSYSSLRYWFGNRETDDRCTAVDVPLSEIYRSAYLRALAWAVDTRKLDRDVANSLAADTVPIDLELWSIRPRPRPDWWPNASLNDARVDAAFGDVWLAVSDLWDRQQTGAAPWGADWVLAHSAGRVRDGDTPYELSQTACFQKAIGAGEPQASELLEWCSKGDKTTLRPATDSPIRFAGEILPEAGSNCATTIGGWQVMPVVGHFFASMGISRWQWWRGCRGMCGPAAHLVEKGYRFRRDGDSLVFESTGEVIGRWVDWTEELRERLPSTILPSTGQLLLIRREVIERFAAQHRARLCWLVRATAFCREYDYKPYQPVHEDRVYGASSIIVLG